MWSHEESIEASAPAARIWALFADVLRWKDWNAGIEAIHIQGPFAVGTTFIMKPPGQDELTSTLVEVVANKGFTDETVVGENRARVSHNLVRLSEHKTRIVYRTDISGPDANDIGPQITADFRDVLAALKALAES